MNIWRILSLREEHIESYRDMLSRDGGMVGDVIPISMGRRISTEVGCGFGMLIIAMLTGSLFEGLDTMPAAALMVFNGLKYILIFNVIVGIINFILHTIGIRVLLSDLLYDMKDNKGSAIRQWIFISLLSIFFWVSIFNVRSLDRTHFLVKQDTYNVGESVACKNDAGNYEETKIAALGDNFYGQSYVLENGETVMGDDIKLIVEKKGHPFWILACNYEGVKNSLVGNLIFKWLPEIDY